MNEEEKEKQEIEAFERLENLAQFFKLNNVLPKESVATCVSYILIMSLSNNIPLEEFSQLLMLMNKKFIDNSGK
jgi:hypothetical protein